MTELPGQLADPGRYLRAQRELADVSRNTLARLARVSESYLTQVEKGRSSRPLMPATVLRRAGYQSGRREGPCAARLARPRRRGR